MPETASSAALCEHVRETIASEIEMFDVLVVTDAGELRAHHEAGSMPGARLAVVTDAAAPLTETDRLLLEIARAGKVVRTWCTLTDRGRRVANETARTLKRHLPNGDRVLHIADPAPHAWQPIVDPFMDLVNGARTTFPPAERKAPRDAGQGGSAQPPPAQFDTDPESIARRIIRTFGDELLIVAPAQHDRRGFSTGYALDESGIWRATGDPWARWLVKVAGMMRIEAANSGLDDKALPHTLAAISRIKRPGMVDPVQQMLAAALTVMREEGEPCRNVTTCRADDLDADLRYLGVANGVVDLDTGDLLPRDQGRTHLVTIRCPVEYHPDAKHPALDKLFSAWSPETLAWWHGVLGHSLRALPKRFYFAVGPPDSGKSTLGTALSKALGRYMRTAAPDVLQKRSRSSETQLTPGLRAWHRPTRIVWINEIKETAINERLTKDLTGGGDRLSARGLHEDLVEEDVTATTFATCNPESIPHLKLTDSGMRSRYRELPYPVARTLDPELKPTLCADPDAQRALLAWLVAAAVDTVVEPDDVPAVQAATTERVRDDAGEIGAFSRRIVRADGVLTVPQAWQAWCEHNGETEEAKEPGGIGKRRLSSALCDHVPDFRKPQQISVNGRNVRGWRGWRLLSLEEAEAQETPPAKEVAEQAIHDLIAAFPELSDDSHREVRQELFKIMHPLMWDGIYDDLVVQALGKETLDQETFEAWRQAGLPDRDAAVLARMDDIELLVKIADLRIEAERPKSPAYEQARDRFTDTIDKKCPAGGDAPRALHYLRRADQELGGDATATELAAAAVNLVVADANEELPFEPRACVAVPELEATIKELCGLAPDSRGSPARG